MDSDNPMLGSTSIHGLQQAGRKDRFGKWAIICWCCLFVSSITVMIVQITGVTSYMMTYPKNVISEITRGETLTFPAVTVCNMGVVRKSAVKNIPTFIAMESAMNNLNAPDSNSGATTYSAVTLSTSTTTPASTSKECLNSFPDYGVIRPLPPCWTICSDIASQTFNVTYYIIVPSSTPYFTLAVFACPIGFTLYGKSSASCHNNGGSWDISAPDYPVCSDSRFPIMNESDFLKLSGSGASSLGAATAYMSLVPFILSGLSDSQVTAVGFRESDMIVTCTFNQQDCDKFAILAVRDSQNGMCYTFNHMNMSQLHKVERSGEQSGVKMFLYSQQDEYLSIAVSGGLKVFIHDQNDPIFYGHSGFMITPGLTYSIALIKAQEIRLNQPAGLCAESSSEVQYYNFFNTSYFQEACVSSFIQSQVILTCNCSAPVLPINDSTIKICGMAQYDCVQQVYSRRDLVAEANQFCPPRCSYTYYQRTSTTYTLKANVYEAKNLAINELAYLKNAVDLSIYFQDLTTLTLQEVLSYTIVNLLSDLGASMGVLAGMSVVSWVEFIYAMAELAVFLVKKMKRN